MMSDNVKPHRLPRYQPGTRIANIRGGTIGRVIRQDFWFEGVDTKSEGEPIFTRVRLANGRIAVWKTKNTKEVENKLQEVRNG